MKKVLVIIGIMLIVNTARGQNGYSKLNWVERISVEQAMTAVGWKGYACYKGRKKRLNGSWYIRAIVEKKVKGNLQNIESPARLIRCGQIGYFIGWIK